MTPLELLAPAKNKILGMAAVDHGADAVYIGASRFGARAAVGNTVREIEDLCAYAHFYRAKVYVALNTLLFDHELEEAQKLVFRLWEAGADALIIQDMGLLELDLPPMPLFASTQTDNRTVDKVTFLEKTGFQRVILARELGLDQISEIRAATRVELEAFVHGALCVCYSGQCYMSAAIGGRSANRGACGQPCRLPWNLVDRDGRVLAENRYLLSLKDMNRSAHLPALIKAGITSFKIEGRLKDLAYVKNITAYYRKKLDALIAGDPGHRKASSGRVDLLFSPDPAKTFSRGATDYYLTDPGPGPVHSMDTPKSRGEALGRVQKIGPDWFTVSGNKPLSNGDGLCFLDDSGKLRGFRVNRIGKAGKIYPPGKDPMQQIPLKRGVPLFRNHDQAFSRQMAGETAVRRVGLDLVFSQIPGGIALAGQDEDGYRAEVEQHHRPEAAKKPDQALAVLERQLARLGNTRFYLRRLSIASDPVFVPAGVLNQLRRDLVAELARVRETAYCRQERQGFPAPVPFPSDRLDFRGNVANQAAVRFYEKRGVRSTQPAFEQQRPAGPVRLMTTRHCICHSLGHCTRDKAPDSRDWKGPLFLENEKGHFELRFDCARCRMEILSIDAGN